MTGEVRLTEPGGRRPGALVETAWVWPGVLHQVLVLLHAQGADSRQSAGQRRLQPEQAALPRHRQGPFVGRNAIPLLGLPLLEATHPPYAPRPPEPPPAPPLSPPPPPPTPHPPTPLRRLTT